MQFYISHSTIWNPRSCTVCVWFYNNADVNCHVLQRLELPWNCTHMWEKTKLIHWRMCWDLCHRYMTGLLL